MFCWKKRGGGVWKGEGKQGRLFNKKLKSRLFAFLFFPLK